MVGIVIAHEFGRGPETDGFFAAYSVFLVLVLVGSALRVAVMPALARARAEGRFGQELGSYAVAIALFAVPALLLTLFAADWLAAQLTGGLPDEARSTAATTLRFVVPAAIAQIYAALAASGLAAWNSYGTAAAGYAAASFSGLALILLLVGSHGIQACAWGMLLNGGIAVAVPLGSLAYRGGLAALGAARLGARLVELGRAVALPLALQGLFVVCIRFVSDLGTGAVTTFTYAYLVASALVAVTASSLGLVSSVPLTRGELTARRAGEHVVRTSWLAFAAVSAAAGVFALVGDRVVGSVLGSEYTGATGGELGRLIAVLGPWMAFSIGVTVSFPLLFITGRGRRLPVLATGALALHVVASWLLVGAWGLDGAAAAMTLTTLTILVTVLVRVSPGVLRVAARGLALAALLTAGPALVAFGLLDVVLGGAAGAAGGVLLFGGLLVATRSLGLRDAWGYLRALE